MSARSTASATVSFGLVSIPVKLYSAAQPQAAISFHMLHEKCHSRVRQQYVCPVDGEVVPRDQIVKGYEFAKDQYVVFAPEEIKALEEKATHTIDITEFLPLEKVDPVYFDKPYYLGPDRGGDKPYALLAEAMHKTGRAALAKYAARGKQYLVLVRATKDGLVMQQLLYADEVRPFSEVPMTHAHVKEAELKLALRFIEELSTSEFQPEQYEDEVRKRILALIEQKIEGKEISVSPEEPQKAEIIDLVEALKASLARRERGGAKAAASEAASGEARKPAKRAASSRESGRARAAKK